MKFSQLEGREVDVREGIIIFEQSFAKYAQLEFFLRC